METQVCTECNQARPIDAFRPGVDASVCGRCRYSSLAFGMADERAYEVRKRDKALVKDGAAYRRLRAEGLQPKGVNRSAELEARADHKFEIKLGRNMTRTEREVINTHKPGAL